MIVDANTLGWIVHHTGLTDTNVEPGNPGHWLAAVLTEDPPPASFLVQYDGKELFSASLPIRNMSPAVLLLHVPHFDAESRQCNATVYWIHELESMTILSLPLLELLPQEAFHNEPDAFVSRPTHRRGSDQAITSLEAGLALGRGEALLEFTFQFNMKATNPRPTDQSMRLLAAGKRFVRAFGVRYIPPNSGPLHEFTRYEWQYDPDGPNNFTRLDRPQPGGMFGPPIQFDTRVLDLDKDSMTFEVCTIFDGIAINDRFLVSVDHIRVTKGETKRFSPQPNSRYPKPLTSALDIELHVYDD